MGRIRWSSAVVPIAVGLALVAASCGGDDGDDSAAPRPSATSDPTSEPTQDSTPTSPATTRTHEPTASPEPTSPNSTPSDPPTEDPMPDSGPLAAAIADLARQADVDADDIEVVTHEPVTWRDGSLGCPEPGKMYTQALVDGYRIVLRVASEEVAYHGAAGKPPFRCDHPDPNGVIG